eukprot:3466242-Pyramimonas_sp.AAC.1
MASRSNEGGEWNMAKKRFQIQSFFNKTATMRLRAPGHPHLDGCQPDLLVHMKRCCVVIVAVYDHPSVRFRAENVLCFQKLRGHGQL